MTQQILTIGGRPACVTFIRVQHANKQHGFYNRAVGRFTDTNETFSMGAAAFAKWSSALERKHYSAIAELAPLPPPPQEPT